MIALFCTLVNNRGANMKTRLIAVASAGMIALAAIATPDKAEARWNGWWVPGAIVGGLALGAAIASSHNYYYGYTPYYAYGYGPYSYGYGPYTYRYRPYVYDYGSYAYYYGSYAYAGPRYYYRPYRYQRPYRHWTEF
jgi:hypothetical protein